MILRRIWDIANERIFSVPSSSGLFNPYRDRVEELDRPDAAEIRKENFKRYLQSYNQMPRLFLLAEAPGPWGCRFSGVPLVSESQLEDPAFPIHGAATSLQESPHSEYTARIYWRILKSYFPGFFTWNTIPFHPYREGSWLSIRTPRNSEILSFLPLVEEMIDAIRPERILAVGRKAEYALGKIGKSCEYIRHPSQGGATKFEQGILGIVKEMDMLPQK